jgi:RadC-like JAB domain
VPHRQADLKELRQFLPKGKAEAVISALSISNVADAEHALSAPLNSAESIYRANLDMKGFHQEVLRPAIVHSAYAFTLVQNHPSGTARPSEADLQITKRVASAAQILQINFVDHVIVSEGFFSFQKAGLL